MPKHDFGATIISSKPDEPAYIKMTRTPRIAGKYWGEGYVKINFVIRKNGKVTDLSIIEEDPVGFGASDSLLAAISDWNYWSAKVNGEKVDVRIIFIWTYCQGPNCENIETKLIQGEQVLIRDDTPMDKFSPR